MHALITGGAGFIGSSIVRQLLDKGWSVTVIDNLSTGSAGNIPMDHPKLMLRTITLGSELSTRFWSEYIGKADYVFHLAAIVGVQRVLEYPIDTIEQNLAATREILYQCALRRKPLVIASSSEVYGHHPEGWDRERDELLMQPPTEQRWAYSVAKLMDEYLALAYHQSMKLPVVIARLFNTCGPRQSGSYGMVAPRFVDAALKGQSLQVYGNGLQRRSFCWVEDTARAMIDLVQCEDAYGECVNVGNSRSISILELAKMIIEKTGSSSKIELVAYSKALGVDVQDIQYRKPDLSKILALIGYKPTMELPEMIDRIVEARRK